jgi:hypothetical protein
MTLGMLIKEYLRIIKRAQREVRAVNRRCMDEGHDHALALGMQAHLANMRQELEEMLHDYRHRNG